MELLPGSLPTWGDKKKNSSGWCLSTYLPANGKREDEMVKPGLGKSKIYERKVRLNYRTQLYSIEACIL